MIGTTVSHYRILEKIGGGGMGVVYKAQDIRLHRFVALKFLPPHLSQTEKEKKRFVQEAKAASALDHPNLCTVFEIEETDDRQLFIAMAYYEGGSLAERIRRGPLRIHEAVGIASQIAHGLSKAHSRGITHRDIKPANVLLTEDGGVKIIDFGLAKLARPTGLTREGATLGTVAYMSPEQTRGADTDHRTDIWALGTVLYEMLSGRPAFEGKYEQAIMYTIINEDPQPISVLRPEVPEGLQHVVGKALAKNPDDRYHNVNTLLADLQAVAENSNMDVRIALPPGPALQRFRSRGVATVAVSALLLISLWLILHFRSHRTPPAMQTSEKTIAVLPFSVRGSPDVAYLSEGMVDLLSTKLDGAGELRSVDPRSLLSFVAREEGGVPDRERGRKVAQHFDSELYILGNIFEARGRLQISASLYDTHSNARAKEQTTVEGEATQLFSLVDKLTAQLLTAAFGTFDSGFLRIAELTTRSLPALKHYLAGESALRKNAYASALHEPFRRAVQEDSSFAMAWYRLARTSIQVNPVVAQEAIASALRHGQRLSEHVRLSFQALQAYIQGDADKAEQLYQTIVDRYPDDLEAWHQLGELYIFTSWRRGRSISVARTPLQRALGLDPEHWLSRFHLSWVAGYEREFDERDALLQNLYPHGADLPNRTWRTFIHGDQEKQRKALRELGQGSDFSVVATARLVALSSGFSQARNIARLATEPTRSTEMRGLGHIILAYLQAANGRLRAAFEELSIAESLTPMLALEYRAHLAAAPFLPVDESELQAIRKKLLRLDTNVEIASESPMVYLRVHDNLHRLLKPYLLGLVNVRLGQFQDVPRYASELDSGKGADPEVSLARDYAHGLRAQVALAQGRRKEALAEFEKAQMKTRADKIVWTSFYQQIHERFLRATLLEALKRDEEAAGWYGSYGWSTVDDYIYFAPSHIRRADIFERLGQPEKAIEHYRKFIALWQDCDPVLRPRVLAAQTRLNQLLRGKSREPQDTPSQVKMR